MFGLVQRQRDHAAAVQFAKRVYNAYFVEGIDISAEDTIISLADGLTSMSAAELRSVMTTDTAVRGYARAEVRSSCHVLKTGT
jgi:predicted DsbA family dithiol-disulfide isomerase